MRESEILIDIDFLTFERKSDIKHELIINELFEMGGASLEHNRIVRNLAGLSYNLFIESPNFECFQNDLRLFDPISGSYCYPDILIVEGKANFIDNQFDTLLNPIFIAEILSTSTEKRDQIEKFEIYKNIPSVKEYMIVSQIKPYIKHFKKIAVNHWELFEFESLIENVSILDNQFYLPLMEIYKKVF